MTSHAAAGLAVAESVAGEVRAELARQRKTTSDLAAALDITKHTAGRRLSGATSFTVTELIQVSLWLGVPVQQFMGDAA